MGPDVFNELAVVIGKLKNHCAGAADKADDPIPQSIYDAKPRRRSIHGPSRPRLSAAHRPACKRHRIRTDTPHRTHRQYEHRGADGSARTTGSTGVDVGHRYR